METADFNIPKVSLKSGSSVKLYLISTLIFILTMVGSIAGVMYFFNQYSQVKAQQSSTTVDSGLILADQSVIDEVIPIDWIIRINKIILLPQNEQPKVVKVVGIEKWKDPFFINASEGDITLIYEQNKKAYLYNPKDHRIVNVVDIPQ